IAISCSIHTDARTMEPLGRLISPLGCMTVMNPTQSWRALRIFASNPFRSWTSSAKNGTQSVKVRTISEICFPSRFSAAVYWPHEMKMVLGILVPLPAHVTVRAGLLLVHQMISTGVTSARLNKLCHLTCFEV